MIASAGILASLIVGAGMFSLPHVFVRAGLIYGFSLNLLLRFPVLSIRAMRIIDKGRDRQKICRICQRTFREKGVCFRPIFRVRRDRYHSYRLSCACAKLFFTYFPLYSASRFGAYILDSRNDDCFLGE